MHRLSFVILVLLCVARAGAVELEEQPSAWHGFSAGLVGGYIDYKEPGLMREYGNLYGINIGYYSLNEDSRLAYNTEGQLVLGRLVYDGGDMKGNRFTSPTDDYIFNIRSTIGLYREMTSMSSITPYIGLGYRDLNDKMQGSGSYNRNISYLYLPIGLNLASWVTDTWSVSFSADYDLVLVGTVVSKLSDVDPSAPDITNHNHGGGYRLVASLRKDFGSWSGHIEPFYQKWHLQQSDGVGLLVDNGNGPQQATLFEPENESDFVGVDIGADF